MLTQAQSGQADRIAGEFATLKDRVVAAGYGNQVEDEQANQWRTEMAVLSQYFELTGQRLA